MVTVPLLYSTISDATATTATAVNVFVNNSEATAKAGWLVWLPAVAPIIVAVIAIVINNYFVYRAMRETTVREFGKLALEHKRKQVNELYGPLLSLVKQNKHLSNILRANRPDDWRFVDHINEVKKNRRDWALARKILEIDEEINGLIINKAGLIEGEFPESFKKFLGHYKLLSLATEKAGALEPEDIKPTYPRDLDSDVEEAHNNVVNQIRSIISTSENILSEYSSKRKRFWRRG